MFFRLRAIIVYLLKFDIKIIQFLINILKLVNNFSICLSGTVLLFKFTIIKFQEVHYYRSKSEQLLFAFYTLTINLPLHFFSRRVSALLHCNYMVVYIQRRFLFAIWCRRIYICPNSAWWVFPFALFSTSFTLKRVDVDHWVKKKNDHHWHWLFSK